MDPCQLSAIITAFANHLYVTLSKEDFELVNVLASELSKSMFSMSLLRGVCEREAHKEIKKEVLPIESKK